MDFFQSQESLTAFEWILRAVIGFIFMVIIGKVLGQRAISQLRLLDFVIALVIGNIIAHPLSDQHLGLKGSLISTTVLVTLYLVGIFINLKSLWFRKLINSSPIPIIQEGKILYKGLKKARISVDLLLGELRKGKVLDINNVALAFWEADGTISIFLDSKYQPITPSTMQIETEPFDLPRTVIKEGKILPNALDKINKDETWVISKLENLYQTDIKSVLLATVDKKDNMKVFFYQ